MFLSLYKCLPWREQKNLLTDNNTIDGRITDTNNSKDLIWHNDQPLHNDILTPTDSPGVGRSTQYVDISVVKKKKLDCDEAS